MRHGAARCSTLSLQCIGILAVKLLPAGHVVRLPTVAVLLTSLGLRAEAPAAINWQAVVWVSCPSGYAYPPQPAGYHQQGYPPQYPPQQPAGYPQQQMYR